MYMIICIYDYMYIYIYIYLYVSLSSKRIVSKLWIPGIPSGSLRYSKHGNERTLEMGIEIGTSSNS